MPVAISALPAASSIAFGDVIPLVQGGVTKNANVSTIPTLMWGTAGTWTTAQTFRAASAVRAEAAATQDAVIIAGRAGGTSSYAVSITPTTLTASRTLTLPDASITVAGSASALTSGRIPYATTGGLLTDSAGMTYDGTSMTLTGALTVPNGTAAAPGIRMTSEAHGLFRASSTNLGLAVAGAEALRFISQGGGFGAAIQIQGPAAGRSYIYNGWNDGALEIYGGSSSTTGGQVRLYGSTHATKASYVEFTNGNTVRGYFNAAGDLSLSSTTASTTTATGALVVAGGVGVGGALVLDGGAGASLRVTNGVANASVATTLGSTGPTGSTAGAPQGWMRVNVGGTDRFIPYW
jgi:uncharacterized protein (DUF1330 family)